MTISIIGGNPTVDLEAPNFTNLMKAAGVLSWCTWGPPSTTVSGGNITAVSPRAGEFGLLKPSNSVGPIVTTEGGYSAGKMVDENLHYLYADVGMDSDNFSIVMILNLDEFVAATQTLMTCYTPAAGGQYLGVHHENGKISIYQEPSTRIIDGAFNYTQVGSKLMVILSASGGTVRTRTTSSGEGTGALQSAVHTTGFGPGCSAVYGADELPDGIPRANRAMRDTVFETLAFDRDILTGGDPALDILDQYFAEVYADA